MNCIRTLRATGPACAWIAGTLAGCLPANPALDAAKANGRLLLEQYDCGSCHVIPGVRRANGHVGPALALYGRRAYIAGELPNHPPVLVQWIQHPSGLVPDTLMPDQGVREAHARDMGAYLMSLR